MESLKLNRMHLLIVTDNSSYFKIISSTFQVDSPI